MSRRLTSVLVVTALAGLIWTAACRDGETEPPPPPPPDPPRPATVTVTPATVTVTPATVQLAAEVRDQSVPLVGGTCQGSSRNVVQPSRSSSGK